MSGPEYIGGQRGWIYLITNKLTGKQYIGQTTSSLKDRWLSHRKRTSFYGDLLCDDIRYVGEHNFSIQILEEVNNLSLLNEREIYWIAEYGTYPNGYNKTPGGNLIGQETADRIARSKTQNQTTNNPKPVNTARKGTRKTATSRCKPVKGTHIITGETICLPHMSADSRFDVRLISACCKNKRKYHRNYRWEYA
jgi:group I intron endonuclease